MKLLLTGVTGAAGSQILHTALADPTITAVTVLARRALPEWLGLSTEALAKTDVVILPDFLNYPSDVSSRIAQHDACIWALGKSANGMSEEEYTKITYDYAMKSVEALQEGGVSKAEKPFRFVFISGEGADQTEKSFMKFARVKGRTEKALLDLPSSSNIIAHIMRPAYFFPSQPTLQENIRSSGARCADKIITPLITTLIPSSYTPIEALSTIAVGLSKGRWPEERLVRNNRIRELFKSS